MFDDNHDYFVYKTWTRKVDQNSILSDKPLDKLYVVGSLFFFSRKAGAFHVWDNVMLSSWVYCSSQRHPPLQMLHYWQSTSEFFVIKSTSPSPPGLCVCERVSQLTCDRGYSSFESESIPRLTGSVHTQTLSTWHQGPCTRTRQARASSLTSSSKWYCTSNVVSHNCVSMCTKKDYGLHCHLLGAHSIHKHLILYLHWSCSNLCPPGALEKSSITDQISFLTTASMSLRQNCLSMATAAEWREHEKHSTCSWTRCTAL